MIRERILYSISVLSLWSGGASNLEYIMDELSYLVSVESNMYSPATISCIVVAMLALNLGDSYELLLQRKCYEYWKTMPAN